MLKNSKKIIIFSIISILLVVLIFWIVRENSALEVNSYCVKSKSLPKEFCDFRIAQVSDLHNVEMGKNNEKLISTLKQCKPDIIVITGDLIDSRRMNLKIALKFVEQAIEIAPCYYVAGNHEARMSEYSELKKALYGYGVNVLENSKVQIERKGKTITILGVNDPSFKTNYLFGDDISVMNTFLDELLLEQDGYTILLSHRPELFEVYANKNIDLVFSGHAHGGQFVIPFIGGVFAPNQGLFPKYHSGLHKKFNTTMVVSRGIGNSIIPFRVNNRPEVVLVQLCAEA